MNAPKNTTQFSTPSDREVRATRLFHAPRRLVWEAWTRPEQVSKWLLGPDGWTMPVCEIDLRPGGAYRYVWRDENGGEFSIGGVYREIVPQERLVHTEVFEGTEAVNTIVFIDEGDQTRVTTTVVYPSKEARDAALATGMIDGWGQSEDRLDDYLQTVA